MPDQYVSALEVARGLQSLLLARRVSQEAFALGMQVLQGMNATGARRFVMTGREATMQCVVGADGGLVAGPLADSAASYLKALQTLHFHGGVLSSLQDTDEPTRGFMETHFTLSPVMRFGAHYGFATPVRYQLPEWSASSFNYRVRKSIADSTSTAQRLVFPGV